MGMMHNSPDYIANQIIITQVKLIKDIKTWLRGEISDVKAQCSTYDDYDSEVVDDEDVYLCRGRAECAESLLNQIKEWENK